MNKTYLVTDIDGNVISEFDKVSDVMIWFKESPLISCELWVINKYKHKWYVTYVDLLVKD